MAWWNLIPALTPVAAWDANSVSATQILDKIGVNHITPTSAIGALATFPYKGVPGNGNPMILTTPVPMPSTGLIVGFAYPKRRNILISNSYGATNSYALHLSDSNQSWYTNRAGTLGTYGAGGQYGQIGLPYFMAMVTRGTDSIFYVNGNLIGNPCPSANTMDFIGTVGYGSNGNEYNLDADEHLFGLGVWTGVATQADIIAIEAEMRAALVGTTPSVNGLEGLGVLPTVQNGGIYSTMGMMDEMGRRREAAGTGTISGNTGLVDGDLSPKRVVLLKKNGFIPIDDTTSDGAGNYQFGGIDLGIETFVVIDRQGVIASDDTPTLGTISQTAIPAFTGPGHVSGMLKVVSSPSIRTVRLYDRMSGHLIRTTKSAANGTFRFDNLELGRKYLAVGQDEDYPVKYNAAVADFLEAVL